MGENHDGSKKSAKMVPPLAPTTPPGPVERSVDERLIRMLRAAPIAKSAARLLVRYSHLNWALTDQTMVSGVNFLTAILLTRLGAANSRGFNASSFIESITA